MTKIEKYIESKLFKLEDLKYREFVSKLMPTVDSKTIIGVRTPEFRKLAKEFSKRDDLENFLNKLPHKYHEENNLHSFIIQTIKDYDKAIFETERFLPYVNNWAVCDSLKPKVFKKHLPELLIKIKSWIKSQHTYTIRFGIGMLMSFYLDGNNFKPEYLQIVSNIKSEEYYVRMMMAWYFATALAKQYKQTVPIIENKKLDRWVHNKSIQKAVESRRISDSQKKYLKSMKIK